MRKEWINEFIVDRHYISFGMSVEYGAFLPKWNTFQRILQIHLFIVHIQLGYLIEKKNNYEI